MSTRRLILTALVAGLAILVAGGIQLLRVARDDRRVELLEPGQTAVVEGARAAVRTVEVAPDAVVANVEVSLTEPGVEVAMADLWRLFTNGKLVAATGGDCLDRRFEANPQRPPALASADGGVVTTSGITQGIVCTLTFPGTDRSATLVFAWRGGQRQWSVPVTASNGS